MKKILMCSLVVLLMGVQVFEPISAYAVNENNNDIQYASKTSQRNKVPTGSYICDDGNGNMSIFPDYASIVWDESLYYYQVLESGDLLLEYVGDTISNVTVPASITFNDIVYNVTEIGNGGSTLYDSVSHTKDSFVMSEGIKRINDGAFKFIKVEQLTIPSTVEYLGKAFESNEIIKKVYMSDSQITAINDFAFRFCKNLESVTLPKNLVSIGKEAFYQAGFKSGVNESVLQNNFTSITIPNTVTEIKEKAFSSTGLEYVKLPDNLSVISKSLFERCYNLRQVGLPSKLKSIESSAFSETELERVSLPEGTTDIGRYAFFAIDSLMHVELPATLIKIEQEAFALNHNKNYDASFDKKIVFSYYGTGEGLTIDNRAFNTTDKDKYTAAVIQVDKEKYSANIFDNLGLELKKVDFNEYISYTLNGSEYLKVVDHGDNSMKPDLVVQKWYTLGKQNKVDNITTIPLQLVNFDIQYDLKDGKLPSGMSNPNQFNKETKQADLVIPEKEGYEFIGWYDESNIKITKVPMDKAENVKLTAKWKRKVNEIKEIKLTDEDGKEVENNAYTTKNINVEIVFERPLEKGAKVFWLTGIFGTGEWDEITDKMIDEKISLELTEHKNYFIRIKVVYSDGEVNNYNGETVIHIDKNAPTITFSNEDKNTYFGDKIQILDGKLGNVTEDVHTVNGVEIITDGNGYYKIAGVHDKDTDYVIVANDKAKNQTIKTLTIQAFPNVDSITVKDLVMIGEIQSELNGKKASKFFEGTDIDVDILEKKVNALMTRYEKLIALEDINEVMEASKTVTMTNVNSSNVTLTRSIKERLQEKLDELMEIETPNEGQKEVISILSAEIKRIDEFNAYYEEVAKSYKEILEKALAIKEVNVSLANVDKITKETKEIKDYVDTHKGNLTGEEVVSLNTVVSPLNIEIEKLLEVKANLEALIQSAEKTDFVKYTQTSVQVVKDAILEAKEQLKKDSQQDDLQKALETLKNALEQLEFIPSDEGVNPDVPDDSGTITQPDQENRPSTGDTTRTIFLGTAFGLSTLAIVMIYLNKKKASRQ